MKDSRYKGNTSDSSCSTFVKILEILPAHPSVDIGSRCGTTAPDAIAACVPNEIQPDISAPLIAPQMAPKLLLHGTSMPRVKIPNVVPAAMADNEVATLNKIKSFLVIISKDQYLCDFSTESGHTSKIPPSFSTTNKKISDSAPKAKTLPLTIAFDALSDG